MAIFSDDVRNELLDIIKQAICETANAKKEIKYLKGLRSIEKEFGISHAHAQHLKNTVLKESVIQDAPGCKVCFEADKARKLYNEYKKIKPSV